MPTRLSKLSRTVAVLISVLACVVVDLIALFAVASSVHMTPAAAWDEDVLRTIEVSALTGGGFALLGLLLRSGPVALGWMRPWSFLVPAALLIFAIARFAWISNAYPAG